MFLSNTSVQMWVGRLYFDKATKYIQSFICYAYSLGPKSFMFLLQLDVAIDGADEVDAALTLIKGGG